MEEDTTNGMSWVLSVPVAQQHCLGTIRHWPNLKAATAEEKIWVTGFTAEQVESLALKTIPHQALFYLRGPKLYPNGSLLPARGMPALLWSPLERVLPVALPRFNHNFFGITESLSIRLVPSDTEREAFALLAPLTALAAYLETAHPVRLKHLSWAIIAESEALILGVPQLPLPGAVFWARGRILLPAGYDLEWPTLEESLHSLLLPDHRDWLVWDTTGSCFRVAEQDMQPLSISSFRLSVAPTAMAEEIIIAGYSHPS